MGLLFSGLLWGSFFILLGLSVILKHTLHVDIPVGRIFFGLFLVYLGVQIATGGVRRHPEGACGPNVVFTEGKIAPDQNGEYNVIFGKGEMDLTGLADKEKNKSVKANTIFGSSRIKVKAEAAVLVKANSAFGSIRLPNGNQTAFGTYFYKTKGYQDGKPFLALEVNAVFAGVEIIEE